MNKSGFMLLEAILTVVIVSICLTFVCQSLLTNFRTGVRFQETVRSLMALENRLGQVFATGASSDLLETYAQPLPEPYNHYSVSTTTDRSGEHLKIIGLTLHWPMGRKTASLDTTTIVYTPNET